MSTKNKFGPIYTILDRFRLVYTNSKKFENQFQKNSHKTGPNWTSLNQFEQYQTSFNIFKESVTTISDKFRPIFKIKSRVNSYQNRAIYFSWNHKNRHRGNGCEIH